jgi:S1-C subfamily serine protease
VDAEIVGRDPATDLALLRANGLAAREPSLANDVKVGHFVISLARTWSNRVAAATGIVSVVGGPSRAGQRRPGDEIFRLDVRPHPAFSGGPVIDASGRLIGIGTAGLIRNAAAAVPAATAWRIAAVLAEHGHIRRGYLGIRTQPVRIPEHQRGAVAVDRGLLVSGIAPAGPAAEAGVLVGDILVEFAGTAVRDPEELLALLTAERIGQAAPLRVLRGSEYRAIDVNIGERQGGPD